MEPLIKVSAVRYRPVFPALRVEPSPDWSSIVPVRVARASSRSIDNSRDVVIVCHRLAISNSFLRLEHNSTHDVLCQILVKPGCPFSMGLKEGPCFLYVLYWGNSIWWRSEKLALSQSYPQAFSAPLENLSHWLWMTFPGRWLCRGGAKTVRTWWPIEGTAGSSPTKFFPREGLDNWTWDATDVGKSYLGWMVKSPQNEKNRMI